MMMIAGALYYDFVANYTFISFMNLMEIRLFYEMRTPHSLVDVVMVRDVGGSCITPRKRIIHIFMYTYSIYYYII